MSSSAVTDTRQYHQGLTSLPQHRTDVTEILLPDMFKSFLKDEVRLNPYHVEAKASSEKWLINFCSLSPTVIKKVEQCDFTFYCAIVYPDAPLEEFRTTCDWGDWVFPYDDMFDEGCLRDNSDDAYRMMDSLMSGMLNLGHPPAAEKSKLVEAHDHIFDRLCKKFSPAMKKRYIRAMTDYRDSVLTQFSNASMGAMSSLEDMLEIRSRAIAGWPMYVMLEYAHDLAIPSEVFEHPVIKALEVIVFKLIAIMNDIVSYRKEEADGVPHNMVALCRMRGYTAQKAFDEVGLLLDEQLVLWDEFYDQLPSWGINVDANVEKYLEGVRNMARANLRSSFRVERYFGKDAAKVQHTRKINVLTEPPFIVTREI